MVNQNWVGCRVFKSCHYCELHGQQNIYIHLVPSFYFDWNFWNIYDFEGTVVPTIVVSNSIKSGLQ